MSRKEEGDAFCWRRGHSGLLNSGDGGFSSVGRGILGGKIREDAVGAGEGLEKTCGRACELLFLLHRKLKETEPVTKKSGKGRHKMSYGGKKRNEGDGKRSAWGRQKKQHCGEDEIEGVSERNEEANSQRTKNQANGRESIARDLATLLKEGGVERDD